MTFYIGYSPVNDGPTLSGDQSIIVAESESDGGGGGGLELPGWVQGHADALVAVLAATTLYHAVRPKRHGEACGDGCKDD